MDIIHGKSGDQLNEFAKKHIGMTGGIIGLICVNGKVQSFVQEFPQTLTDQSFLDVMRELTIAMRGKIYEKRIITL